jgi:hypothetical protein
VVTAQPWAVKELCRAVFEELSLARPRLSPAQPQSR